MKIIVGIGNPGAKYAETRHNIGFMVVDKMAERHGIASWRRRFHALAAEGALAGEGFLLMKPDTYVNESGRAVSAALHWCRLEPADLMIVCDDFNLELCRLRVRGKGSSGGHNGLESVMAHLNTEEVPRLRIGIGPAQRAEPSRAKEYVLSRFGSGERVCVENAVERAVRALEVWLEFGLERCQNEFNSHPKSTSQENEEADA